MLEKKKPDTTSKSLFYLQFYYFLYLKKWPVPNITLRKSDRYVSLAFFPKAYYKQ